MLEVTPERWNTYPEFRYFETKMSDEEIHFVLCELEDIEVSDDHSVRPRIEGEPISVVYKRALIQDLERARFSERFDRIRNAIADGRVSCVNSLRSRLSGSKALLAMLSDAKFREKHLAGLSSDEERVLDSCLPKAVLWNRRHLSRGERSRVFDRISSY